MHRRAPPAKSSYLNIPQIVAACEITGADAVHPGYGFLSENARFAEILEEHEITFIGPTSEHIRIMGDKIEAKSTRSRRSASRWCRVRPARSRDVDEAARSPRDRLSGAGQGCGRRRRARHEGRRKRGRARAALSTAQTEAKAAFGDDTVYLEKYLGHPRHIEIQVLGDGQGRAIHLGERDCSIQRRHQKLWEEALSPALNASERARIGEVVAEAMRKLGYRGVGTVEFLYENGEFYFIEMNTRLQVEHPVTEMVTGIDLVIEQIRIASGAPLTLTQDEISSTATPSNAESMPRIRALSALSRQDHAFPPARRAWGPRRFRRLRRLHHSSLL